MIEWIIKKVIVKRINKLLDGRKQSVEVIRAKVALWLDRVRRVVSCLESLIAKIEDGEITADEITQAGNEITELVKGWK